MAKRKSARTSKSRKQPKRAARATQSARAALSVATSARKSVSERVQAMAGATNVIRDDTDGVQELLRILRDQDEHRKVRLAALASIQAASFSVIAFESCRGDYVAALREVASDPDAELRQRALGLLARDKDGYAQKKLLEGLEDPSKALVPTEKALQLLGHDVHTEAYKIARRIVAKPPSEVAKREALRLLAADSTAKPMFEKILRDKSEAPEYRRISASALHAMAPDTLQKHARAIVLDASDSDEVQAASLTAIEQFGDRSAVSEDKELKKRVGRIQAAASGKVKQTARRFLTKYGK